MSEQITYEIIAAAISADNYRDRIEELAQNYPDYRLEEKLLPVEREIEYQTFTIDEVKTRVEEASDVRVTTATSHILYPEVTEEIDAIVEDFYKVTGLDYQSCDLGFVLNDLIVNATTHGCRRSEQGEVLACEANLYTFWHDGVFYFAIEDVGNGFNANVNGLDSVDRGNGLRYSRREVTHLYNSYLPEEGRWENVVYGIIDPAKAS
jgi:hypothetical protein